MYADLQMSPPSLIWRWKRLSPAVTALLFSLATPLHAAFRACRPTDKPLVCRLESILTFLYTAAGILGFLLMVAVFAAVRTYKRKARKLSPDEITPDAQ